MILSDSIKRYEICMNCEKFNSKFKICEICMCYMPIKTRLQESYCPLNKWGKNKNSWRSIDDEML